MIELVIGNGNSGMTCMCLIEIRKKYLLKRKKYLLKCKEQEHKLIEQPKQEKI